MGKNVFANGLEIAGGASDNLVIAAFPDVCLSPPPSPTGPIPIPYPDSSKSKDLKAGSKDVSIGSKAVCLGSKSYYKTTPLGNEASTKTLGMNVIDHVNAGNTHCQAFSMNVNVENEPVTRTTDITTSNHGAAQQPGGCILPMVQTGGVNPPGPPVPLCECCGAPAHSPEQAAGKSMSAADWYNPPNPPNKPAPNTKRGRLLAEVLENAQTLLAWSKEYNCGNMHPEDSKDPCAKHYAIEQTTGETRDAYEFMYSPTTTKDALVAHWGPTVGGNAFANGERLRAANKAGARSVAHLTPLAAGGCPIGAGNTSPVFGEDCHIIEKALGEVQKDIKDLHVGKFRTK
jgi:hypothetical protein